MPQPTTHKYRFALALVVGIAFAINAGAAAEDKPVKDMTTLNVRDFGAVPDGTTDNTAAFQAAVDAAHTARGGVVSVPTGNYSFAGCLKVPAEVTLRGIFSYAPSHAGIRDKSDEKPEYGTVLLPRAGAGSEEGDAFITLSTNSTVEGVCVHYPDQKPDAQTPTPYPYTIAMRGNNPALLNTELLNPYNGIDAGHNQRALIRDVHGQPIHIGVYVDDIYDISRIENVHWNPWWSLNTPVFRWQMEHGIGFLFGRTDWQYVLNTFCFGYHVGYQFIETKSGVANGNFSGIGADNCQTAIEVQNSAPFGLLITNGEFVSFDGPDPTMVRVTKTNKGVVRFSNCAYWGPCNQNAIVEGEGTVGFSDCTFVQWGRDDKTKHAIQALSGTILVRGCEFRENKPQILIDKGVVRAVVTDNVVKGSIRIDNNAAKNANVGGNVGTE